MCSISAFFTQLFQTFQGRTFSCSGRIPSSFPRRFSTWNGFVNLPFIMSVRISTGRHFSCSGAPCWRRCHWRFCRLDTMLYGISFAFQCWVLAASVLSSFGYVHLFTVYALMRCRRVHFIAYLSDHDRDCLTNLRFADDVMLFATSKEQIRKMMCDFKKY